LKAKLERSSSYFTSKHGNQTLSTRVSSGFKLNRHTDVHQHGVEPRQVGHLRVVTRVEIESKVLSKQFIIF
jgi:hypothetical protein